MISKAHRLSRKEAEALKEGKSVFATLLSLRYLPSNRFLVAISVPKKIASKAVDRNRIRRQWYSAVQDLIPKVKKPAYIMVFPKKTEKRVTYKQMSTELKVVFTKTGIIS